MMGTAKKQERGQPPGGAFEAWREKVNQDLSGASFEKRLVSRTYDDIAILPLYHEAPQHKGEAIHLQNAIRSSRLSADAGVRDNSEWDIRQAYDITDPATVNRAILEDLQKGTTSVLLELSSGNTNTAPRVHSWQDLNIALEGVLLDVAPIDLSAGPDFMIAAAALAHLWQSRGIANDDAIGGFHADPLGTLATEGRLPCNTDDALTQLAQLAAWTAEHYPRVRACAVDTAAYNTSGASDAQELAFSMATALEYLRAMEAGGLPADVAYKQIAFHYRIDVNFFSAIARLRAARTMWARIVNACGVGNETFQMWTHVRPSARISTERDPWVNQLRNTACCFAAALGGADAITTDPWDSRLAPSDSFGRRVARNTQLILSRESHLARVIDPAGGSYFLEHLTLDLGQRAWSILQQIEKAGGMVRALQSGLVAELINTTAEARRAAVSKRKQPITGVSEFANLAEERPEANSTPADLPQTPTSASDNHELDHSAPLLPQLVKSVSNTSFKELTRMLYGQSTPATIDELEPHRDAAPYEAMRNRSDGQLTQTGNRPRAFLANLGTMAQHTARATFSTNLLAAGGIEAHPGGEQTEPAAITSELTSSGARVAIICGSDDLYELHAAEVARSLKAAGATRVLLAGRPGKHEDALRASGIDEFIFMGCDVIAALENIWKHAEVQP